MSGLAAVFYKKKTVENSNILDKILEASGHRAVDGIYKKEFKNASFAYLKTINLPESKWEQTYEDSDILLIADARIDGREVLFKNLGLPFDDKITPTEIIASAYKKYGNEVLRHIIGDFVFVLYDKNKDEIVVGKDHMGIRPLYYFVKNDEYIAFASEVAALQNLPDFKEEINHEYIQFYLNLISQNLYGKSEMTIFNNIKRFIPSSIYKINKDLEIENKEYWATYDYFDEHFFDDNPSLEKIGAEFLRLLKLALKDRNRSEFRISSDFSGGLDSSTVSILSSELNKEPLITFNNISKDERNDESKYIIDVLTNYNVEHYWLENNYNFENAPFDYNDSINDPAFLSVPYSWFNEEKIKIMKGKQSRVLLTGHDGDTLVSHGHDYMDLLFKNKEYKKLKEAAEQYNSVVRYEWETVEKNKVSLESKTRHYLYHQFFTKYIQIFLRQKKFGESVNLFFNFILINGISFKSFAKDIYKFLLKKNDLKVMDQITLEQNNFEYNLNKEEIDHLKVIKCFDIFINNDNLSSYFAKHQIEILFPFYDKRLIDFCVKVPLVYKFNKGVGRGTIRTGVKEILPKSILERTTKAEGSIYIKDKMVENIDGFNSIYKKAFEKIKNLNLPYILNPNDFSNKMTEFTNSKEMLYGLGRRIRINFFLATWLNNRLK